MRRAASANTWAGSIVAGLRVCRGRLQPRARQTVRKVIFSGSAELQVRARVGTWTSNAELELGVPRSSLLDQQVFTRSGDEHVHSLARVATTPQSGRHGGKIRSLVAVLSRKYPS
jgi:hypothetical protein